MSAPSGLTIKTNIYDMQIGDCIPFRYTATTSNATGAISELGTCNMAEIPVIGSATPDGLAYFIKADKGLLICDRVVQYNVSWNVLNAGKYIEGKQIFDTINLSNANTIINKSWSDSKMTYVTGYVESTYYINCINLTDYSIKSLQLPGSPIDITGNDNYVAIATYSYIVIIDRATNDIIKQITAPNANYPGCIIHMDNTNIYTCSGQGVVNVVSLSDFSLSYISGFSWPSTLCIDNNDDDLLYIVDKYTMYIAIYQKSTKTKIKVISNLNTYNSRLNYITVDDDNIYVTSEDNNLAIIDKKLYTLKKRIGAAGYGKLTNTKNYVYIENNNRCFNKLTQTIEIMSVPLLQSSLVFQYDGNKYIYAAYYGGDGGWYFLILDENNKFYNLFNSYSNSLIYIGNNKIITNNGTTLIIYNFDPLKIKLIRSLTGGNSYLGADGKYSLTDQSLGGWPIDSEWDKYIVKSNLNGKITPGDNNIWHWNGNICSFVKDTTNVKLYANTNRIVRGDYLNLNNPINYLSYYQSSSASASHVGFRPVLEYIEFGSKQTNLWY